MKHLKLFENFNNEKDIIKIADLINGLDLDLAIILCDSQNIDIRQAVRYLIESIKINDVNVAKEYRNKAKSLGENYAEVLFKRRIYDIDIDVYVTKDISYEQDANYDEDTVIYFVHFEYNGEDINGEYEFSTDDTYDIIINYNKFIEKYIYPDFMYFIEYKKEDL